MKKKIDLNCDMGEGFGLWSFGNDEAMMEYVTSANLACGYHAGDPNIMRKSVELCKEKGIAIGAHVGLPDLMGFGRRRMDVSTNELKNYIIYQIGALQAFLDIEGVKMQHMKLHGALFSMAAENKEIARAALEATQEINDELMIFTMENTETYVVAKEMGFKVAREFYGDRGCEPSGLLTFKYNIDDIGGSTKAAAQRIVRVLEEKKVRATDGKDIDFECETFCIHSDTVTALDITMETKQELEKFGWSLAPLKEYF